MSSNNFEVFNPTCANQETDATYTSDSTRTGGIAFNQITGSALGNKMFYQWSIMVAAIAAMLVDKGYSPNDGNASPSSALTNLTNVLNNILTNADCQAASNASLTVSNGSSNGAAFKLPPALGGFVVQFGNATVNSTAGAIITLPITAPTLNVAAFAVVNATSSNPNTGGGCAHILSTSQIQVYIGSVNSPTSYYWLVIGY
jgi:hypothetical protein